MRVDVEGERSSSSRVRSSRGGIPIDVSTLGWREDEEHHHQLAATSASPSARGRERRRRHRRERRHPPDLPESVLVSILRNVAGVGRLAAVHGAPKDALLRTDHENQHIDKTASERGCALHGGWRHAAHAPDLWRDIVVARFGHSDIPIDGADARETCRRLAVSPSAPYFYMRARWWRAVKHVRKYRVRVHSPFECGQPLDLAHLPALDDDDDDDDDDVFESHSDADDDDTDDDSGFIEWDGAAESDGEDDAGVDENDEEEESAAPSSFDITVPKRGVTVTEHALILKLPGLDREMIDRMAAREAGMVQCVRVTVMCEQRGGGNQESPEANGREVLCTFRARVGRVLLAPTANDDEERDRVSSGETRGRSLERAATLFVNGFVRILHRVSPKFCREVCAGGGRVPGYSLPGWGSADAGWGLLKVETGGDVTARTTSVASVAEEATNPSAATGSTSDIRLLDLPAIVSELNGESSLHHLDAVRRQFLMTLVFTSDAELSGLVPPTTAVPSIIIDILPIPCRMTGTSVAVFKFSGAAAKVMSLLERCPVEYRRGLRCSVAFTHKSGHAHVFAMGLSPNFGSDSSGGGSSLLGGRAGSRAGNHRLIFQHSDNGSDAESEMNFRTFQRGLDNTGAFAGMHWGGGGDDDDDYVAHPVCVELDYIDVSVGHSLLVSLPLPALVHVSQMFHKALRR